MLTSNLRHTEAMVKNLFPIADRFDAMTAQRYRGGRHGKGERLPLLTRVALPLSEAVREHAEDRGMSVNDFIASILAREVGMSEFAPESPVQQKHEELLIADVA